MNPALRAAFDTTSVFATQLPLVHEVGHMLGVMNTRPRTALQTTGVPGNDPYSTAPTAVAAWRAMAPNLAAKGVPLTSPAHDKQPGDAYVHWDCSIVPDIMACLLPGATVTAVTVGAMQDAGIPISSAAADPPALDVSHEIVSPAWRVIQSPY